MPNHPTASQAFDEALASLTFVEREVIKLRSGLADGYEYSHEDIARIFRISADEVRQIELAAAAKLERGGASGCSVRHLAR